MKTAIIDSPNKRLRGSVIGRHVTFMRRPASMRYEHPVMKVEGMKNYKSHALAVDAAMKYCDTGRIPCRSEYVPETWIATSTGSAMRI